VEFATKLWTRVWLRKDKKQLAFLQEVYFWLIFICIRLFFFCIFS
jgi:hypothetical protein